jgi:hypothetical protein
MVNIAPCKADGTITGEWIAASAHEILDPQKNHEINNLLNKKYGLMKAFLEIVSKFQRRKNTLLEIKL